MAQTQQDVIQSLSRKEVGSYALDLILIADLILQVARDPKFPKRQRQAQINFMADSIGGHGLVTPRSSRDICERERARIKRVHRVIRYEYYVRNVSSLRLSQKAPSRGNCNDSSDDT